MYTKGDQVTWKNNIQLVQIHSCRFKRFSKERKELSLQITGKKIILLCSLIARQAVVPCVANRMRSLCYLTQRPLLLPYVSLDKALLLLKFQPTRGTFSEILPTAFSHGPYFIWYKMNPMTSTILMALALSISATYHFTMCKRFIRTVTYLGLL